MYQLPKLVLKPIFVGFCWIWDRLLKSCQVPREFYDQTGTHPLSTVPIKGLGCWRDQTKNISTVSVHINPQKLSRISFVWIKVISQCRSTVSPRIWHVLCVPTLPASNVCIAEGSQLLPFLPWRLESPPGHDGIVSLGTFKKTVSCAALYHLRWEKARTEEYAAEVCDFPWFQDLLSELEEIGPRIYSVLEQDVENCGDVDSDGFRSGSFVAQSFAASKRWVKATAFLHLTLKRPPSLPN